MSLREGRGQPFSFQCGDWKWTEQVTHPLEKHDGGGVISPDEEPPDSLIEVWDLSLSRPNYCPIHCPCRGLNIVLNIVPVEA
jgi:hypothetical protein